MDVLVTAASRNGSTAEIGRVIARLLEARELNVVVAEPEEVERLDNYDAVIIGSAVYAGHWLEPAAAFVRRHESQLRERPVFVFSSGPLGEPLKPDEDPAELASIDDQIRPIDHRIFAGRLVKSRLSFPNQLAVAVMRARTATSGRGTTSPIGPTRSVSISVPIRPRSRLRSTDSPGRCQRSSCCDLLNRG